MLIREVLNVGTALPLRGEVAVKMAVGWLLVSLDNVRL